MIKRLGRLIKDKLDRLHKICTLDHNRFVDSSYINSSDDTRVFTKANIVKSVPETLRAPLNDHVYVGEMMPININFNDFKPEHIAISEVM